MKAVVLKAFGGIENLELQTVPDPVPGPGEVLMRVRACALNHLDLWIRAGLPGSKVKPPHILGSDASGEILSLGPGVDGFAPGARAAVHPGRACGSCAACRDGRDGDCPEYGIIGAYGGLPGAYAEKLVVPAKHLLPMPDTMSFEEAASLPLAGLTAWHMLATLGEVKAGQTIVIIGAGAGVSVAAIQIAKSLGARVIATSTDAAKLERAKALGADDALHSPPDELPRSVRRLTGGAMADCVFEHVGAAVFMNALKCLRPSGRMVTCGATSGFQVELDLRYVFSRQLRIYGAKMGNLDEMRAVWSLAREGKLKGVVDRVYPLAEARAAHERLKSRGQFGKVVLLP
ncbi:MAG: alcohol dehydrogenase [Elusimicrobia bacterium CG11_big_fil_rev_8_21_14_0_20_64_6]|nr:MAG: alcohol dehydrogenase [Elusimicrobia bacterium CG11_big_fil_rev_8_21_14_0_20_64_6]